MIFRKKDVAAVLSGTITAIARAPSGRWKEGHVYSVQPGRYQFHVGHVRVVRVYCATMAELEEQGTWDFKGAPDQHPEPTKEQEVTVIEPADLCDKCRSLA